MSSTVSPAGGVTIVPDNAVVDNSDNITILRCISQVKLGIEFEWAFNDTVLENEITENLTLTELTASENGGRYSCNVNNLAGNGTYTTSLFFNPVITASPIDELTFNGSLNVTFTCNATGYPTPHYEWFKNDNSLPRNSIVDVKADTSTLTISPVEFGDEGAYYCSATANNISVASHMATLHGMFY